MKAWLCIWGIFLMSTTSAQTSNIRPLPTLINKQQPAWAQVLQWKAGATNKVEILPKNPDRAATALYNSQVTTKSPMGAITYESGGILIDDGWIRILGSGSPKLNRSIDDWNKGKSFTAPGEQPKFWLIADDVLGGLFALNAGAFSDSNIGKVYYFAPDELQWSSTGLTYTDFIHYCFNGALERFYEGLRWDHWQKDVSKLPGDQAYACYPYLFTKQGQDINKVERIIVPIRELWNLYINMSEKLPGQDNKFIIKPLK
jgi:hypothetical protein